MCSAARLRAGLSKAAEHEEDSHSDMATFSSRSVVALKVRFFSVAMQRMQSDHLLADIELENARSLPMQVSGFPRSGPASPQTTPNMHSVDAVAAMGGGADGAAGACGRHALAGWFRRKKQVQFALRAIISVLTIATPLCAGRNTHSLSARRWTQADRPSFAPVCHTKQPQM